MRNGFICSLMRIDITTGCKKTYCLFCRNKSPEIPFQQNIDSKNTYSTIEDIPLKVYKKPYILLFKA